MRNSKSFSKGFTLIEIMIALLIVALVVTMAIPRLGRGLGTQIRTTTRKVVVLTKQLHHLARLKNRTYRLVIDFGGGEKNRAPRLYVESAHGSQLMSDPDAHKSIFDKEKPSAFTVDTDVLKRPIELPGDVSFKSVETEAFNKPIREGLAYIHFFPQGLVDKSVIYISNGDKINWSLLVNPLTGQTIIRDGEVRLKDLE